MLEEIALSISTAIFFVCAFLVNGLVPQTPEKTAVPCEIVENIEDFTLVGTWSGNSHTLEFTKSGKLVCNDQIIDYTADNSSVTVSAAINGFDNKKTNRGSKPIYTMKLELLDESTVKLGGVTLRRAD